MVAQAKSTVKVATYNLRMDTKNHGIFWPNRKELVKNMVKTYDFDIFKFLRRVQTHMLDGVNEVGGYTCFGGRTRGWF